MENKGFGLIGLLITVIIVFALFAGIIHSLNISVFSNKKEGNDGLISPIDKAEEVRKKLNDRQLDSLLQIIAKKKKDEVCYKKHCFEVELARTHQERSTGLMGRESLDKDEGMLFFFDKEGRHSFWMKNTLTPLDIIWIDSNKEVIFISKNTQPCKTDFCPTITPDKKAKYVLEINGGTADEIGLAVGSQLSFLGLPKWLSQF